MDTHTILVTWTAQPAEDAAPTLPPSGYHPVDAEGADATEPYEIGRGGLGRVLTYRDMRLGRIVACKELSADPGRGLERFLREASITAQLEHPSIVPVHELGEREDGSPFYTMKYVRGTTLATAFGGCRTLEDRLGLLGHFEDLCHAVAYAHSQGAIHRDIKPANVMVGEFGETQLLDWGLVKLKGEDPLNTWSSVVSGGEGTLAGSLLGTPAYMSPEQAWGRTEVDERADTWSLGIVLFELLTGTVPFEGETSDEVLAQVRGAPVPSVRSRCPEVPADLAAIADKALSRDPEARYQDAAALADDIEAFRAGALVRAYHYSAGELLWRFIAEHRTEVGIGLAGLAALLLVAGVMYDRVADARDRAEHHLAESIASQALSERVAADAALADDDLLQARARLRRSLELADSPEARAIQWHLEATPLVATRAFPGTVVDVEVSPDGTALAVTAEGGSVYVVDPETLAVVRVVRDVGDRIASLAWIGEDRIAFLDRAGVIRAWTLADDSIRIVGERPGELVHLAAGPQGRWLAAGAFDGTVYVWDLTRPGDPLVLTGHERTVWKMDFDDEGTHLVSTSSDRTARVWDLEHPGTSVLLEGTRGSVGTAAFRPDGRVATAGGDYLVRVWDADSGAILRELQGHAGPVDDVDAAADLVASGGWDGAVHLWWDDGRSRLLGEHAGKVRTVALTPSGDQAFSGGEDKLLKVWKVAFGELTRPDSGHEGSLWDVRFSPDGTALASVGADSAARVWDLETGEERMVVQGQGEVLHDVAWRSDGGAFVTAGQDKVARVWDAKTGRQAWGLTGHLNEVMALDYHPGLDPSEYRLLVTASGDRFTRLWDVSTQKILAITMGRGRLVMDVDFHPGGSLVATCDYGGNMVLYDAGTLEEVGSFAGHEGPCWGVDFSADGRWLASAGEDGSVRVWDVANRTQAAFLKIDGRAYKVDFHPDGERVGVGASDGVARIWSWRTGEVMELHGHRGEVRAVRFDPEGHLVATAGTDDNTVRLWNLADGRPVWHTPGLLPSPPRLVNHRGWVAPAGGELPDTPLDRTVAERAVRVVTSADGTTVCVATRDGALSLWSPADPAPSREGPLAAIDQLVAAPGACLARVEGKAWVLDANGLRALGSAPAEHGPVRAIGHGEGTVLLATDASVTLHTGDTPPRAIPVERGVRALTLRGDRLLLGFSDGAVQLLDLAEREPPLHLQDTPAAEVISLASGPAGTVVVGYTSGDLGLWSTRDGTRLRAAHLHGAVADVMLEDRDLVVATELGEYLHWDLGLLYRDRCPVLREVWNDVALAWERGAAVHRPPPADHPCALE